MEIDPETVTLVRESPVRGIDQANRLELFAAILAEHGIDPDDIEELGGSDRIPRSALLSLLEETRDETTAEPTPE